MPTELQERATGFLSANPAFTRGEFAAAVGLPEGSATIGRLLKRETDAGRLQRLNGGVLAAGPNSKLPGPFAVPDYVYASKLRPDGVLGYHTALELYGISYTVRYNTVHLISTGRPRTVALPCRRCRIVRPHRTLIAAGETDFLTVRMERQGVSLKVTAFERTLVDVLHRADRAGGRDEVIECLNVAPYLVDEFDCSKVADYVELLGISSVAGVVGWWLERWQTKLDVSLLTLERLHDMLPGWKPYGLRARPGHSALNRHWRVYLPPDAIDTSFEGTDPEMEF
ncbi:MAG: hypothetical protein F4213_07670 [Boseongicola sp. SB0677_bin_26]|nr:hypothetical protein [Boseongicola sp. SB0665_bin_10]MYG25890.1 hypothetical protein [Boseongicola sp. SB0677_bin_26]